MDSTGSFNMLEIWKFINFKFARLPRQERAFSNFDIMLQRFESAIGQAISIWLIGSVVASRKAAGE